MATERANGEIKLADVFAASIIRRARSELVAMVRRVAEKEGNKVVKLRLHEIADAFERSGS